MFVVALFRITKILKEPKCSSVGKRKTKYGISTHWSRYSIKEQIVVYMQHNGGISKEVS